MHCSGMRHAIAEVNSAEERIPEKGKVVSILSLPHIFPITLLPTLGIMNSRMGSHDCTMASGRYVVESTP